MYIKSGFGALFAGFLVASPAFAAVTVTNQDTRSHTITIDRGATETQQDIAGGKSVKVNCPADCGFHDESNGYSRIAGGDSKLVIDKDAELHFWNGHGDMLMSDGSS